MARPPPPTPQQLILRPPWANPTSFCFRRQGCHPAKSSNGDSQLSMCILQHQFLINLANFLYHCKQRSSWCFKSCYSLSWYVWRKARRLSLLLYLPANSILPESDCLFLFMFRQTAEMVLREKINKKDYILLPWWSIESVPEISLPPCIILGTASTPLLRMSFFNTPTRSRSHNIILGTVSTPLKELAFLAPQLG